MGVSVNDTVKIINEYSQLVLEVEGEATTEGTRIEQYTDTGKGNQRWRLKPAGPGNDGFYNIENVNSTMSLEVVDYSKESGAEIVQRPYDDGPFHRQWELAPVAGKADVYKIVNRNSGLVLDGEKGIKKAPAPVKQYESWNDDGRQQWKLVSQIVKPTPQIPTGIIKITAKVSGKVLDVTAGPGMTENGATIRQWDWVNAENQKFSIEPVGDSYYRIVAKVSGKVLDVTAGPGMTENGATIRQWDWVNAENQKWKLG